MSARECGHRDCGPWLIGARSHAVPKRFATKPERTLDLANRAA